MIAAFRPRGIVSCRMPQNFQGSLLRPLTRFSRRRFLQGLSLAPGFFINSRLLAWSGQPVGGNYAFDEIPPSSSGITWVHTAGKSAEKYLPETSGAGCAFLDYDNDGWMDIYLVNSGKCDFYNPPQPLRNALYRNNRDGTFTDVTEKAGVAGGGYGMGVAVGRLRWRWISRSVRDAIRTQHSLSQQRRRHFHATSRKKPEWRRRAGARAPCGSITTTTGGSICSFASLPSSIRSMSCGVDNDGMHHYCIPRHLQAACRVGCSTTMATEHSRT